MENRTKEEVILEGFDLLLENLARLKPNDRSPIDRYWAIVNTEVEKAKAIFLVYCEKPEKVE